MTCDDPANLHIGVAGPCTPTAFAKDLGVPKNHLPDGLGGTPVNHLVRALIDLGYRVSVATLAPDVAEGDLRAHVGPRLTLYVGPYRKRRRARDRFAVERAAVRDAMAQAAPDAISAHWSYEFALGAIESGCPTLVTVHDVPREIFRHHTSPYRWMRWMMHREAMKRASAVAFNSEYTRTSLRNNQWSTGPVLPNVLPDSMWCMKGRDPPKKERPVFVSVNNGFDRRKNVHTLLRAFTKVLVHQPLAQLILVGIGYEPDGPAAAWSAQAKTNVGVQFRGPLDYEATLASIGAADVLVHPALEESFGYTLIEAASLGTPVIAGAASGAVPWVLGNGAQGALVDVTSPDAIASEMIALVDDLARWERLRTRAFEVGKARFSATSVAAEYASLLGGLANARAKRSW